MRESLSYTINLSNRKVGQVNVQGGFGSESGLWLGTGQKTDFAILRVKWW